jgi:NADH-quinone oxidoreductase subunit J
VTGLDLAFAVLALIVVGAAFAAVTSRQVVHAALYLVAALAGLAAVYLVLGAEVVALVQLLVYVGAVVVLVLFALMLTRAPIGPRDDLDAPAGQRAVAALAGLGVAVLLAVTLTAAIGGREVDVDATRGGPRAVGEAVFGGWVLAFELLSVLLLAALVAALAVSRGRRRVPTQSRSSGDRTGSAHAGRPRKGAV